jgi:benzoyl-CoA reductase/2-hydroxyglutaryl-CoA dehydratase subunit BcrC/BadD/HgdB
MKNEFNNWVEHSHEAVKKWKRENDKKVVGYFCCVTPEEMIYAVGALPARIIGSTESLQKVNDHIPHYGCAFVRSCVDLAARGIYDYLDAVIIPNACDLIAKVEYWWRVVAKRPPSVVQGLETVPYVYYIKYPEKVTGREVSHYYLLELRAFKQYLERLTGQFISDDMLSKAVEVYNEHYRLMEQLDELRKPDPPLVSGYESWEAEMASLLMPKEEHNRLMRNYLEEILKRQEQSKKNKGVRIYLSGAAMDKCGAELYRIIEECGGQVVSEDISVHSSHYKGIKIDSSKPPMEAIVERSLATPCPRNTFEPTLTAPYPTYRGEYVKKGIKGYNVQGVIFYTLGYCECRACEIPMLRDNIRKEFNIPVLFLDGDYTQEGLEQTRGKIEAFVEMIEQG